MRPVAVARSRQEFVEALSRGVLGETQAHENGLLAANSGESFTVEGFCVPCNRQVAFIVDMQWGGRQVAGRWLPNWRERLQCPHCGMNNRQRLMATLVKAGLGGWHLRRLQVYLMEQVTPIYRWTARRFRRHRILGSEYLGPEHCSGTVIRGICHQDVMNLGFRDAVLDLIVSNDVFEHVPDPVRAFGECARVLRRGGLMLATIPFYNELDISRTRARIGAEGLVHLLPPEYHGNPVSPDGSLVFTDFGWDVLARMREAGFSDAALEVHASVRNGHLGGGQLVFRMIK